MKKLTEKLKAFCEEYVKCNYKGGTAYGKAYGQENKQVCASEAYKLLKDPRILEEIKRQELSFDIAALEAGISKPVIMKAIARMLDAKKMDKNGELSIVPDWTAINSGIITYAKLTGQLTDKKKIEINSGEESEVDVTKMNDEERKAYELELLAGL